MLEKGNADLLFELPSVIKKCNNTIHHSIKMTPVQASKKANEKLVFDNLETREKNLTRNLKQVSLFVQLILREFLVKVIQQSFHIDYTR